MSDIIDIIRKQAQEIADEGLDGWGNTMSEAADAIAALREEVERMKAKNEELEDANCQGYEQLKRLAEEGEEWKKAALHLQHMNLCTTCAYCGEFFEADDDGRKVEALQEHMQKCEKHPMTALRSRLAEAEGKVERAYAYAKEMQEQEYNYGNIDIGDTLHELILLLCKEQ